MLVPRTLHDKVVQIRCGLQQLEGPSIRLLALRLNEIYQDGADELFSSWEWLRKPIHQHFTEGDENISKLSSPLIRGASPRDIWGSRPPSVAMIAYGLCIPGSGSIEYPRIRARSSRVPMRRRNATFLCGRNPYRTEISSSSEKDSCAEAYPPVLRTLCRNAITYRKT